MHPSNPFDQRAISLGVVWTTDDAEPADLHGCDNDYFLLPVQVPSPRSPSMTVPFMLSLFSIFPV